jgi:hypothetical protein
MHSFRHQSPSKHRQVRSIRCKQTEERSKKTVESKRRSDTYANHHEARMSSVKQARCTDLDVLHDLVFGGGGERVTLFDKQTLQILSDVTSTHIKAKDTGWERVTWKKEHTERVTGSKGCERMDKRMIAWCEDPKQANIQNKVHLKQHRRLSETK